MLKVQLTIVAVVLVVCSSNAEARGRRMVRQQSYPTYYNTATPTYNVATPSVNAQQGTIVSSNTGIPATTIVSSNGSTGIVQASSTMPAGTVFQSNSVVPAGGTVAGIEIGNAVAAAQGSAQWKAEQIARMGTVQHIGGGFGGGSFEGNGFGATREQAIQNACFWGQKTPIEIGVARGANGYYATIFYR